MDDSLLTPSHSIQEYSFALPSSRRVRLQAFHYSLTYAGLLGGLSRNQPGYIIEAAHKAEKTWAAPVYTIQPATITRVDGNLTWESWPSYCYKANLDSKEIDPKNDGSHLTVVWFEEDASPLSLIAMVAQACRDIPWEEHAEDYEF